jgi:hypothetical protein
VRHASWVFATEAGSVSWQMLSHWDARGLGWFKNFSVCLCLIWMKAAWGLGACWVNAPAAMYSSGCAAVRAILAAVAAAAAPRAELACAD